MTILYNCKSEGASFRITKFDDDLNPTSSYLTDGRTCDCPAAKRPMCRHREMLPRFQHRGAVDTGWMFDYDRGGWVQMEPALSYDDEAIPTTDEWGINGYVKLSQDSSGVEQGTHKPEGAGSIPAPATKPAWRRF